METPAGVQIEPISIGSVIAGGAPTGHVQTRKSGNKKVGRRSTKTKGKSRVQAFLWDLLSTYVLATVARISAAQRAWYRRRRNRRFHCEVWIEGCGQWIDLGGGAVYAAEVDDREPSLLLFYAADRRWNGSRHVGVIPSINSKLVSNNFARIVPQSHEQLPGRRAEILPQDNNKAARLDGREWRDRLGSWRRRVGQKLEDAPWGRPAARTRECRTWQKRSQYRENRDCAPCVHPLAPFRLTAQR